MDQKKTRQAFLFLGLYNINQIKMFTSSPTKTSLLGGHGQINQTDIITQAPH